MKALKELGLNQIMIARELNVERQAVNAWFTGRRFPSAGTMQKLHKAINNLTGKIYSLADIYNLLEKAIAEHKEVG